MQNDLEYNNAPFINDIEHYKSSSFLELWGYQAVLISYSS